MSLADHYRNTALFNQEFERGQQNALAKQAGGMIASGDRRGAANVLNRGGALEAARTVQTDDAEQHKREVEFAGNFATGIAKRIKAGMDPEQARSEAEQWAATQGMSDHVPGLRQKWQEMGPEAFVSWLGTSAAQEWQAIQLGDGGVGRFSKTDGTLEVIRKPQLKPVTINGYDYMPEDPDGQGGQQQPAAPAAPMVAGGFGAQIGPLMQREGGYVARDGRSGAPANFGINQKYNPDVDVKNLTPEKAQEIYKQRYWDAIDGDNLPPEAQGPVFDAAVNQGPQRALQWWQQSGGDVAKFNQLRLQHYRSRPDYAKNGASWERRVTESSTGQNALAGGPGADDLSGAPQIPGYRVLARAKPAGEGRKQYRPATPAEKAQYGLPPGTPAKIDSDGNIEVISGAGAKNGGRLPAAALNIQKDSLDAIQLASAIDGRLEGITTQLDTGKLNLGPVRNIVAGAANFVGRSDEQTRNYASFRANLEKLRNDSLRLNKGVQTEGDAQRAWNELMANLNDEGVVKQRLQEIQGYNRQAVAYHEDVVTQLREDAGMPPIDASRFRAKPPPAQGGGKRLSPAEAAKLKPGTKFIGLDGVERVRQ